MTTRLQILDMVGKFLTEQLGQTRVTQRPDGILILAGETEAFALQVLTINAPDGVSPEEFGPELVKHIEDNPGEDN